MKTNAKTRYMVCLKNEGAHSLVLNKFYETIPDAAAEKDKYVRVIDESGEDYLYPESRSSEIELPLGLRRAIKRNIEASLIG